MIMTVINLPKILRDRLTDEGADAFVQILDRVEERNQQVILDIAEQKFEARLAHLDAKIDRVAAELNAKIDRMAAELRAKMSEDKAEIIKWMFIFWVGQVATILAILFVFFKR
ncbi:MAG: DUF1640 domain-containing protein [Candidatus Omnitrophica bacterium]|nr:DUF1640 domain-containing protein [Candidatus Omnitrophota bacterium]